MKARRIAVEQICPMVGTLGDASDCRATIPNAKQSYCGRRRPDDERGTTIMARPREFDEAAVLDAAIEKFWQRGYEATSVRDLADEMNIAGASLYNAFGDKRSLYV